MVISIIQLMLTTFLETLIKDDAMILYNDPFTPLNFPNLYTFDGIKRLSFQIIMSSTVEITVW